MRYFSSLLIAVIGVSSCATALAQGELPPGTGTAKEGATLFAQKCAACHGPNGNGGGLTRGIVPLGNAKPVKIPFSLVPYATTVWDFINRAMPQSKPGSLTTDEVYAATAYVLYRNG